MKTAIKKSLVLVALLLATRVSYGNEISGNTNDGKNTLTNVSFGTVKKGSTLSIKDMNGLVLYREIIRENGKYAKGFDLSLLSDGDYYFELNKDVEITVVSFKVFESIVTFDKNTSSKIFKPMVFVNKKNIHVSKISLEDEVLQVKLFSKNSKLIYSGSIVIEGNVIGKTYDLPTSLKGNYIIANYQGKKFCGKYKNLESIMVSN
jgi:hypothetical protein